MISDMYDVDLTWVYDTLPGEAKPYKRLSRKTPVPPSRPFAKRRRDPKRMRREEREAVTKELDRLIMEHHRRFILGLIEDRDA